MNDSTKENTTLAEHVHPNAYSDGITLRDYFAAKAMAGIMAIPDHWYQNNPEDIAEAAYIVADAMMDAREP